MNSREGRRVSARTLDFDCTPIVERFRKAREKDAFHCFVFEGGSRCFAPDTKIATEHGEKAISEVTVGERVYCLDKDGRRVLRRVKNIFRHPVDKPMVEIKLKSGDVIRCSADHKFLYNGEYVPIIDILRQGCGEPIP